MMISETFGEKEPIKFSFDTTTEILSIHYEDYSKVEGDRNQIVKLEKFISDIRKRVI